MFSLDDVDALADAICFCFRGGMVLGICEISLYVECKRLVAWYLSVVRWRSSCVIVVVCWMYFGRIGVFVLFMPAWRASSFALALHWRWRHRGKCRWLVTPEPHRHQLPAAIPSSPPLTTSTYLYIATISEPPPPHRHQLTHRQEPTLITPHRPHTTPSTWFSRPP